MWNSSYSECHRGHDYNHGHDYGHDYGHKYDWNERCHDWDRGNDWDCHRGHDYNHGHDYGHDYNNHDYNHGCHGYEHAWVS